MLTSGMAYTSRSRVSLAAAAVLLLITTATSAASASGTDSDKPPAPGAGLPSAQTDPDDFIAPDDVPSDFTAPCGDYAREQAEEPTESDKWICVGDKLTTTDPSSGQQDVERLEPTSDDDGSTDPDSSATTEPASSVTPAFFSRSTTSDIIQASVIDGAHANKTVYVAWNNGVGSGVASFSYTIGIYNHSGRVKMGYVETSGKAIIMDWKLRIRHDKSGHTDSTVFTYPDVMGSSSYRQTYSETEDQYGDGYNQLPYEKGWDLFWDSYNIDIRYAATNVRADNSAQSDRVTCYKTTACKFRG